MELRLRSAGTLAGIAYDADRHPLDRARISLTAQESGEPSSAPWIHRALKRAGCVTADAEGRFEIRGLAPGCYVAELDEPLPGDGESMVIEMRGQEIATQGTLVTIAADRTTQVELALTPMAHVSGNITDAARPVPDLLVTLRKTAGFTPLGGLTATTDAHGTFDLRDVEPGDYTVSVWPPQAPQPVERHVSLRAREMARCDIALPTGVIAGRVIDGGTHEPVEGVTLSATRLRTDAQPGSSPRQPGREVMRLLGGRAGGTAAGATRFDLGSATGASITTDREGRYELRHLDAGSYRVAIEGKGIAKSTKDVLNFTAEQSVTELDFQTVGGATLLVYADSGGEEMLFCLAHLSQQDHPEERTTEAVQGSGPVRFDGLNAGRYRLELEANERRSAATIEIGAGEQKTITVKLRAQS
jgi:hypothetical protein